MISKSLGIYIVYRVSERWRWWIDYVDRICWLCFEEKNRRFISYFNFWKRRTLIVCVTLLVVTGTLEYTFFSKVFSLLTLHGKLWLECCSCIALLVIKVAATVVINEDCFSMVCVLWCWKHMRSMRLKKETRTESFFHVRCNFSISKFVSSSRCNFLFLQ